MNYMLTHDQQKIATEWEKYKGYTIRPLASALSYYSEIIASHPSKTKFMLYGGTPELRTLFQRLRYPLTLVDRSPDMVAAMGLLTCAQRALSSNEHYLKKDWLQLEELNEEYDLLIGDDAINMVPWPKFELFLSQAWKCLRPKGLFICHLLVKPSNDLIYTEVSEVVKEFRQGSIKSTFDLASRLNFLSWDESSFGMGWQKTIQALGESKLALFKPELDFIATFKFCNSQFYCPPLPLFEKLVKKYFFIRDVFYPQEHDYCSFEPIYVLEK